MTTMSGIHGPSLAVALAAAAFAPHPKSARADGDDAEPARPNVVLIMADDQGWGDVGSHGNDRIRTPRLDALAASGARFDRFFVSPVCAPTRASLLTGRYSLRTGSHGVTRAEETMRSGERTLAEMFRDAGYATGCFGKWHNGAHFPHDPNGQGFDEFLGFCAGHWNNYFDTRLQRNREVVSTSGFIADVLTDAAIAFLDTQHAAGRPFFCYVPLNTPHSPWQVPDEWLAGKEAMGLDDTTACAYAMCENIDWNVGRLLDALDDRGLARDTIVLFLSDNGPNGDRFNGGMRGRKGSFHEGGVRVPLFIRWPGRIAAGRVVSRIAAHVDILPTLADLCGVPAWPTSGPLDGMSLAPLLIGTDDRSDWPDRGILTFWPADRARAAVRTQRWRLVRDRRNGSWELFDMTADPAESRDLAQDHREVVEKLAATWEKVWEESVGDGIEPIPTEVGHPEAPEVVLPAHEAALRTAFGDSIRYHGSAGWANDWIEGWSDPEASAEWPVRVVRSGRYAVSIDYACPQAVVGTEVIAGIQGTEARTVIIEAHEGQVVPSPDRVPRKEVPERIWRTLGLGAVKLRVDGPDGGVLRLHRSSGAAGLEVKAVRLRRIGDVGG